MPDMVNILINYQETVVSPIISMQCHSRILNVMAHNVLTQLL